MAVVMIEAAMPNWTRPEHGEGAERATVPISYSVAGADPVECEISVVPSSSDTGWAVGTRSDTPCWPKPGRAKQSKPRAECRSD